MRTIRRTVGTVAIAALVAIASLLAACGNKGPLVKPPAASQPQPATAPDAPAGSATDGS
jgi:predicted small lipoprotein YifL